MNRSIIIGATSFVLGLVVAGFGMWVYLPGEVTNESNTEEVSEEGAQSDEHEIEVTVSGSDGNPITDVMVSANLKSGPSGLYVSDQLLETDATGAVTLDAFCEM